MIGIGLSTTPNRQDIFEQALVEWKKYQPEGSILITHNDVHYDGVAQSKNKLLRQLYDKRCQHFFIADDDCIPLTKDWWKPYIEHREPHMMYQFKLPSKPSIDMQELYRDDSTVAYSHTRGAMIYVERIVLDVVGGMDTRYTFGYEHADWTNRIHNTGLTAHRAMDIPNSDKLLYCLDQDGWDKSSVPESVRRRNSVKHRGLYHKSKASREFKEFR